MKDGPKGPSDGELLMAIAVIRELTKTQQCDLEFTIGCVKELVKDWARMNWLEKAAEARKVEIAKSLFGTGFEIGEWPSLRVTVANGSIRDAIDKAMK